MGKNICLFVSIFNFFWTLIHRCESLMDHCSLRCDTKGENISQTQLPNLAPNWQYSKHLTPIRIGDTPLIGDLLAGIVF